jgi:peptidoglycan/xylan/chitin deacetylase (PgdA/CDA1 family)
VNRVIINFHGLGPMPAHVDAGEAKVWCTDTGLYAALLDETRETGLDYLITFDDGNVSDLEHGLRPLADRGMSAIFFPCAGRIGQPMYLDQGQLRELVAAGMEIGSHGWSHIRWPDCDAAALQREVAEAKDRIEQAAGVRAATVAIPFGDYNSRVLQATSIFDTIFTSDATLARPSSRLQPRFSYYDHWRPGAVGKAIADSKRLPVRLRKLAGRIRKRLR